MARTTSTALIGAHVRSMQRPCSASSAHSVLKPMLCLFLDRSWSCYIQRLPPSCLCHSWRPPPPSGTAHPPCWHPFSIKPAATQPPHSVSLGRVIAAAVVACPIGSIVVAGLLTSPGANTGDLSGARKGGGAAATVSWVAAGAVAGARTWSSLGPPAAEIPPG